jgi:hypothetical protein
VTSFLCKKASLESGIALTVLAGPNTDDGEQLSRDSQA